MTADKRNAEFAYLRKKVFDSKTPGLYPSVDFTQQEPDGLLSTDNIVDVLGSQEPTGSGGNYDIKVIVERGDDLLFFNLGGNSESNTSLTDKSYECGVFGNDGVHICVDGDELYKVGHANSNTTAIGVTTGALPDIAGFDGLYYWWLSANEIYKQIGSADPTLAFNDLGVKPRFVDFLADQMLIYYEIAGGVGVLFWDKSDEDLFDKRIFIPNCKLIAGGVVNGRAMLVTGVGNSSNTKEQNGEIVVSGYDGEKFVRMNSIRAGQRDAQYEDETSVGIGSNVMLFSVTDNTNEAQPDLYQNYLYKVRQDGSIEVADLPDEEFYGEAHVVRVFYNFSLFATRGDGDVAPRIYTNEATDTAYDHYEDYSDETVYVTNFMCAPYNRHKLDGISISFEKLFENLDLPPVVESSTITPSSLLWDSVTLSWDPADDDFESPEELEYKLFRSASNNISSYADMLANGTVVQDWAAGDTSVDVDSLSELTTYYFNVAVRDGAGQISVYTTLPVTTPEYTLVTDWTSPGANAAHYPAGLAGSLTDWTNPGNVASSDDSAATASNSNSYRRKWYDFGFAIPGGAVIKGIEVKLEGKYTANPSAGALKLSAAIYKDVVVDGEDMGGYPGISQKAFPQTGNLTDADVVMTRGGYAELWGTTWTPAEINATNFGFSVVGNTGSSPSTTDYSLDQLQVRIIYKP